MPEQLSRNSELINRLNAGEFDKLAPVDCGGHAPPVYVKAAARTHRAVQLMRLAAERFRNEMEISNTQHYDDADCDGYCLADDLETLAEELELEGNHHGSAR